MTRQNLQILVQIEFDIGSYALVRTFKLLHDMNKPFSRF